MNDVDDKNLVIVCVFLLCLALICLNRSDYNSIVNSAISGLFGVAVGKSLNGGNNV